MRMIGGVGQYIFNNAFGQFAAPLVFLQHDRDIQAGFYIVAFVSIHGVIVSGIAGLVKMKKKSEIPVRRYSIIRLMASVTRHLLGGRSHFSEGIY